MSLRPNPIGQIPADTVRVARAAFPKGTVVTRLRDEFTELYCDEDFEALYPQNFAFAWPLATQSICFSTGCWNTSKPMA
jgi:hypothetical protein